MHFVPLWLHQQWLVVSDPQRRQVFYRVLFVHLKDVRHIADGYARSHASTLSEFECAGYYLMKWMIDRTSNSCGIMPQTTPMRRLAFWCTGTSTSSIPPRCG